MGGLIYDQLSAIVSNDVKKGRNGVSTDLQAGVFCKHHSSNQAWKTDQYQDAGYALLCVGMQGGGDHRIRL